MMEVLYVEARTDSWAFVQITSDTLKKHTHLIFMTLAFVPMPSVTYLFTTLMLMRSSCVGSPCLETNPAIQSKCCFYYRAILNRPDVNEIKVAIGQETNPVIQSNCCFYIYLSRTDLAYIFITLVVLRMNLYLGRKQILLSNQIVAAIDLPAHIFRILVNVNENRSEGICDWPKTVSRGQIDM